MSFARRIGFFCTALSTHHAWRPGGPTADAHAHDEPDGCSPGAKDSAKPHGWLPAITK